MLQTVESVLKSNPEKGFTLPEIWWELRNESHDLEFCITWQPMFFQMMNQIESLRKENKIIYKQKSYINITENIVQWKSI